MGLDTHGPGTLLLMGAGRSVLSAMIPPYRALLLDAAMTRRGTTKAGHRLAADGRLPRMRL